MCVTDRHDMTLALNVALKPNQPIKVPSEFPPGSLLFLNQGTPGLPNQASENGASLF